MGLFFGLAVGLLVGVALVAGLKYMMGMRSKQRILKAVGLSLLGQIDQDDVKRLCSNSYPSWLSFQTFERVKWLNKELEKIWPYVAAAASEVIRTVVEPMLEDYCPIGFKMGFSKLSLGNVAPKIEGIRIQSLKKGQLIMDLEVRWGGDPSIILAVRTPVGAHLPVQLKNLQFFATVRVIFQLADDMPCISGLVVALLADPKPVIKYTLKLIGGSLSGVPGLSDMINDIVENIVTDTLQWPHRILVPIAQPPVDLSDLELKLQGKLTVTVSRAKSLKNMEMIGKSDPYVVVYIRILFKEKTRTINNNLNPEWNETFQMNVEDQETQKLVLKVMDEDDVGADKLLGLAVYPLEKLKNKETVELTLNLVPSLDMDNVKDKKDRGAITVTLNYQVFTKDEQVAAMEAEKALLEERKKVKEGLIGGTIDVIGGAVGGAGKLVIGGVVGGVGVVGSGVGMVGSGIGKAGRFVTKNVSGSFSSRKARSPAHENGIPGTPK